jgi:hypothetical protein
MSRLNSTGRGDSALLPVPDHARTSTYAQSGGISRPFILARGRSGMSSSRASGESVRNGHVLLLLKTRSPETFLKTRGIWAASRRLVTVSAWIEALGYDTIEYDFDRWR